MKEKFAVVKFISEDDATGIISTNWLSDDKTICFYPNCPNNEKALKKHLKPGPDWKAYPVDVMVEDDNYSDARRHLKKSTMTSNLDSDEDDNKRKRNKVSRFTFGDSDEEDINHIPKKLIKNKKRKVSAYPPLNSFDISSPYQSVNVNSASESHSSDNFSTQQISSPVIISSASCPLLSSPTVIVSESSASSCPMSSQPMSSVTFHPVSSQPMSQPCLSQPSISIETDNRLALIVGQLQTTIADLVQEVRELRKRLDMALNQNSCNANNYADDTEMELIGKLPINSLQDFNKLEESLKEIRFHNLLVKVLVSLGGKDLKTFTYNILRRSISCQLALNFSFTGKQPKNKEKERKRAFCSTLLYRSIQASVKKVYPDAKDDVLKGVVSLWLQQAKHRQDRRDENNAKAATLEELHFRMID